MVFIGFAKHFFYFSTYGVYNFARNSCTRIFRKRIHREKTELSVQRFRQNYTKLHTESLEELKTVEM